MPSESLSHIEGRPVVLSVGGFDPSAGAGVLQDIKVAEAKGCFAVSAATAITYQNDRRFSGLDWVNPESLRKQLESVFERFQFWSHAQALFQGGGSLAVASYRVKVGRLNATLACPTACLFRGL